MSDPRVAAVGDNLEDFMRAATGGDDFTTSPDTDVVAVRSDYAVPLFNAISGARFAPGTVERRAREVVAPYVERGLPFLWWATPAGHSEELSRVLPQLGMSEHHVPGMHMAMTSPIPVPLPPGVRIEVVGHSRLAESIDVMIEGFDLPPEVRAPFLAMSGIVGSDQFAQLTAWLDDRPVGCGTLWLTGDTGGLYNIATLAPAQRRGIGYAVTAALMNLALERGASQVVLNASEAGYPVYRRLGFDPVCDVPQFVWVPAGLEQ